LTRCPCTGSSETSRQITSDRPIFMKPILQELNRQLEPKLFFASLLHQFGLPRFIVFKVLGLTKLQIHVLTEREKMTRQLWFGVMKYYGWTCACCKTTNFYNQDPRKRKNEVDHIKPVSRWGYTVWENLQILCSQCNKIKECGFYNS